jgi:uncharacterized protein (TIGR02246 family)
MKTAFMAALIMAFTVLGVPSFAADSVKSSKDTNEIYNSFSKFFESWNKHDVKGMIAHWTDNASLINPMGRAANGKAELEKLLTDEQTMIFKDSTANLLSLTTQSVARNVAWYDGEMTIDNAMGPDGAAMPELKIHITGLMQKDPGRWLVRAARPYSFTAPPPAKNN